MNQWICPVGGKSAGVHLAVDPILQLIHRKNWTPNIQSFGKHSPCPRYSVANLDDEAGRMLFFPVFPLFFRIYGEFLCISRKSMSVKRVVYDVCFGGFWSCFFKKFPKREKRWVSQDAAGWEGMGPSARDPTGSFSARRLGPNWVGFPRWCYLERKPSEATRRRKGHRFRHPTR